MGIQKRPYSQFYDASGDLPLGNQVDNPVLLETVPSFVANRRTVVGSDGNAYVVADQAISARGSKNVIWSSEGFTQNGISIPALTTNQKKANGTHATNYVTASATCVSPSGQALPSGVTLPAYLDLSPYRNISIVLNLSAITGTSLAFEFDVLDDTGTPVSIALHKPAAMTAAGSVLISIGPGVAFAQAAAAPSTAAAGFGAIAAPTGWTYYSYPLVVPPNGSFVWTVSSVTAATWTAWIYGIN